MAYPVSAARRLGLGGPLRDTRGLDLVCSGARVTMTVVVVEPRLSSDDLGIISSFFPAYVSLQRRPGPAVLVF